MTTLRIEPITLEQNGIVSIPVLRSLHEESVQQQLMYIILK